MIQHRSERAYPSSGQRGVSSRAHAVRLRVCSVFMYIRLMYQPYLLHWFMGVDYFRLLSAELSY